MKRGRSNFSVNCEEMDEGCTGDSLQVDRVPIVIPAGTVGKVRRIQERCHAACDLNPVAIPSPQLWVAESRYIIRNLFFNRLGNADIPFPSRGFGSHSEVLRPLPNFFMSLAAEGAQFADSPSEKLWTYEKQDNPIVRWIPFMKLSGDIVL